MRLDKLLAQEKISRKAMKQALLKKEILVDGQEAPNGYGLTTSTPPVGSALRNWSIG